MKSITISKRASAVLGAAVAATLSAGIASAVWTSPTGNGNGSAKGYQSLAVTVTDPSTNANNTDATSLFPGSSVTNTIKVNNPNPYDIVVTAITQGAGNTASGSCAANTVNFATRDNGDGSALLQSNGTSTEIPAHGSGTYNVVVTMISGANNACQGLDFTLPATVSSKSSDF